MPQVLVPDYIPSDKQTTFHTSKAFETFFGGAAGPGKTAALAAEAITSALEKDATFVYVFRKTMPELMLSIHAEISRQLSAYNNSCKPKNKIDFNGQSNRWKFPNGSFIQYAFCQYDADVYRYQSAEIHTLLVDELTHFKQEWYDYFKTRVRSNRGHRLRVMSASNPGNIGHGWVKKYFVSKGDQVLFTDPETNQTRVFIRALIDDHPSEEFRTSYIKTLEAITNPRLKKALRWGNWDAFEGQVFMEWDERIHVIDKLPSWLEDDKEVDIISVSQRAVGHDIGRRDPGAAEWLAKAPENEQGVVHYYMYREFYQQWRDAKQWANDIKDVIDDESIEYVVLPHDAFAIGHGASKSYADEFDEADIPIARANSLGNGSRMHRQNLLHQLLSISPDGTPYLQVLSVCVNFIRTLPDLPYSETKREDIDDKAEDHAYDGATYGLMVLDDAESWIVSPNEPKSKSRETPYQAGPNNEIEGVHIDVEAILKEQGPQGRDWKSI